MNVFFYQTWLELFPLRQTFLSKALREEIDYGINDQELPVIVIYPEYDSKETLLANGNLKQEVRALWDRIPIFRDSMHKVPTLHVPLTKSLIESALRDHTPPRLHSLERVFSKTVLFGHTGGRKNFYYPSPTLSSFLFS